MTPRRLGVGERVRVRSAEEILGTLDDGGALDGLPFMPEMIDWTGQTFRVLRGVEKTCVSGHPVRRFPHDDVVILDGPRCDGQAHDGCKRGCRIFWKQAWLRPADDHAPASSAAAREALRARLPVKSDPTHYSCQSTRLLHATERFPRTRRMWRLRIPYRELRSGDVPFGRLLTLIARWGWTRLLRLAGADGWLRGSQRRTPSQALDLSPGDRVRIKSRAEIAATLDPRGQNRGMRICYEMVRCCGAEARVRYRVDRLIDEDTGVMRPISDTVTLTDMDRDPTLAEECLCYGELGDCPRGELMYWREIWLEKVGSG